MFERTKENMLYICISVIIAALTFFMLRREMPFVNSYLFIVCVLLMIGLLVGSLYTRDKVRGIDMAHMKRQVESYRAGEKEAIAALTSQKAHHGREIAAITTRNQGHEAALRMTIEQLAKMLHGNVAYTIGTRVVKPEGYAYPGEVRGIVITTTGELRYVVELMTRETSGMLHIFNEKQIATPVEAQLLAEIDKS